MRSLALFISYSHKDDDLRAKLDAHLSLLKRQHVFNVWHDRRIAPGEEWAGEIDQALESAEVVLLLISSDFLASDYCYDNEMRRALERHGQGSTRVVPVILRRCDWQASPFGKLQALPRDGQAVTAYADVDAALTEVAVALRALADEIRRADPQPADHAAGEAESSRVARAAAPAVPASSGTLPESDGPPAAALPPPKKLKIGAIKFWFVELGPFELDWPPQIGMGRVVMLTAAAALLFVIVAAITFSLAVKPHLDEARELMRRAEYGPAVKSIEAAPSWSQTLPWVAGLLAQARFGRRLDAGEHIRNLTPELAALSQRFPQAPDVLVFQGTKSYYVDGDPQLAIEQFTHAANNDPAHIEAHFLAASRHIDLAYIALAQGAESPARSAIAQAQQLIERAVKQSPFAQTLPRYANQMGELQEVEGNPGGAYKTYSGLAAVHPLSALQAALLSWRLPDNSSALRHGREMSESALSRVMQSEQSPAESGDAQGWTFRVGATDPVELHPRAEKACLLAWTIAISTSLQGSAADSPASGPLLAPAPAPAPCGKSAAADLVREIVCVQVLTALQATPLSNPRHKTLEAWRSDCSPDLRPLQALPWRSRQ